MRKNIKVLLKSDKTGTLVFLSFGGAQKVNPIFSYMDRGEGGNLNLCNFVNEKNISWVLVRIPSAQADIRH